MLLRRRLSDVLMRCFQRNRGDQRFECASVLFVLHRADR
jgi:hypothetical protein